MVMLSSLQRLLAAEDSDEEEDLDTYRCAPAIDQCVLPLRLWNAPVRVETLCAYRMLLRWQRLPT